MKGYYAFVLLLTFSCSTRSEDSSADGHGPKWEGLMVTWNDRSVSLDNSKDTLYFFESDRDSLDPTRGNSASIHVDQADRDSIWVIALRLMRAPSIRAEEATDYGGDYLRLKLYAQGLGTTQTLEYSSQIGWPREGDLGSLRSLTFDRFENDQSR